MCPKQVMDFTRNFPLSSIKAKVNHANHDGLILTQNVSLQNNLEGLHLAVSHIQCLATSYFITVSYIWPLFKPQCKYAVRRPLSCSNIQAE